MTQPDDSQCIGVPTMEGYVQIGSWNVSIALLQGAGIGHAHLAKACGLTIGEYVDQVVRWAEGIGLPYGVGVPRTYVCPECSTEAVSTTRDEIDPRIVTPPFCDRHPAVQMMRKRGATTR